MMDGQEETIIGRIPIPRGSARQVQEVRYRETWVGNKVETRHILSLDWRGIQKT